MPARRRGTPLTDRLAATAVVATALLAPIALVVFVRGSRFDLLFESVTFHLFVVGGIAAMAVAVAVVAAREALASPRADILPLAVGLLATALLMLGHGLVTPGVFGRPGNLWVARFPVLAVLAFAVGLWLVHRRASRRLERATARRDLLLAVAVVAVPLAVVVTDPTALGGTSALPAEGRVADGLSAAAAVMLLDAGRAHWRRWRLSGSSLQRALMLAAWLSVAAVVSLRLGAMWHLSWWDYHAFLLAGFGAAVVAIVQVRRRDASVDDLLDTAFHDDPFVHIVQGYPEALRALVAAVEAKDHYTHGHSARVAELSVRLGLQLGLVPDRLRALARGAYLHDVGKIAIPDALLNKPGPLTDAERARIEEHPETGVDIVRGTPSLTETVAVVRHHHERIDGGGYPDGLSGEQIPLVARICAVADVWDALTSDRAYRDAMSPAEALAIIVDGAGSHLDPEVVEALCDHLAAAGLEPAAVAGDATIAEAAQVCHDRQHAESAVTVAAPRSDAS